MNATARLLDIRAILTPADHQTHRRYAFEVPTDSRLLEIGVRYAPKQLGQQESLALAEAVLVQQAAAVAGRLGEPLAEVWLADYSAPAKRARIANLLTISLDDADGVYRGAGHRHSNDQHFALGAHVASPGLLVGPLTPGQWTLTLSAHTLVSDQCELSIQIEAEIASSR